MAHHLSCPIKETDAPRNPIKPYRNVASDCCRTRDSGPPAGGCRRRPVANEKCPGQLLREGYRVGDRAGELIIRLIIFHAFRKDFESPQNMRVNSAIKARF